ncbi:hypothetical protein [Kitasatospora cheerisanensis]|nr:hypothetical protein [Kitasatospora cheerisanensis]
MALLRTEYLLRGVPAVPDEVLVEIVEEVLLPLVRGRGAPAEGPGGKPVAGGCGPRACSTVVDEDTVRYAPADTGRGALERGRGAGYVWALREREAGREAVLDCLRRDTRYDRQSDARHDYLAQLVGALALPLDPLRQLLDSEDQHAHERGDQILAALALTGSVEAREALRQYVRHGRWWQGVLDTLAERCPAPWWDDLAEVALRRLDGAEPEYPSGEPWLRWRELLPEPPRPRPVRRDRPAASDTARLLAVLADGGSHPGERSAAVAALARRPPVPELLPLVPELYTTTPAELGERGLPWLGRAVERLGVAALADARGWALSSRPWLSGLGLSVLARHGEEDDLPLLLAELEREWADRVWCGPDWLADGLARFGPAAAGAAPALHRFWAQTPHSYERPAYLRALTAIRPGGAGAELTESLWDCEYRARLFAVEHAPDGPELRSRLAELRDSPVEPEDVRAAAARRLGGGNG